MTAVTIQELAEFRLGRKPESGADFLEVGLSIMGGCEICGASLGSYNAYPSTSGYWRCADDIDGLGFETVTEAAFAIYGGSVETHGSTQDTGPISGRCHDDHVTDRVYETDAGTYRVTRHRSIFETPELAAQYLAQLDELDRSDER